jgi:hypothetical protein
MNVEQHRSGDPALVRVTRDIPLPWLIGVSAGLLVQAVILFVGQQTQSESTRALISEVKELRVLVQQGTVKDVEYGLRLDDHERRMTAIENGAQAGAAQRAADEAGRK